MEKAVADLNEVVADGDSYLHEPIQHLEHLRLRAKAIDEELAVVAAIKTTDDKEKKAAADASSNGRVTRRALDKAATDLEIAEKLRQKSTQPQPQATPTRPPSPEIETPVFELPTFDGDYTHFKRFYNAYNQNILKNKKVSSTNKWIQLRKALKGNPATMIAAIPETEEMLPVALKVLSSAYGSDDKIISGLYYQLNNLAPATSDTHSLRMLQSTIEGILLSLQNLDQPIDQDRQTRSIVLSKIPSDILFQIAPKNATLQEIRINFESLVEARESVENQIVKNSAIAPETTRPARQQRTNQRGTTAQQNPPRCVLCAGAHWTDECPIYVTAATRKNKIPNRCHKCLRFLHPGTDCPRSRRCVYCDSLDHNRALCPVRFKEAEKNLLMNAPADNQPHHKRGYFLTLLTKVTSQRTPNEERVRVVLDSAGGRTLITKELATKLGINPTKKEIVNVTGLDEITLATIQPADIPITFRGQNNEIITLPVFIVERIASDLLAADIQKFKAQFPQFKNLHIPPTGQGSQIDILIGNDTYIDVLGAENKIDVNQDLSLLHTAFGWIVMGRCSEPEKEQIDKDMLLFMTEEQQIQTMYDLEILGLGSMTASTIEEEQKAISEFYKTLKFVNGRYSVGWPWREYPPPLTDNFGLAMGRLRTLYRRLQKTPNLLKEYDEILINQEREGIIEKVTEKTPTGDTIHYLPHHPIIKPEKSTAVRPVYDGSATAVAEEHSLNQTILKGTKWLNDLVETLLRFRRNEIALTSDIAKAFHQISINEKDRDVVRFIWLKNINLPPTNENIQIFRFTRIAFGIAASPFLLHATIQHHLQLNEFPGKQLVQDDLYADNLVTSLSSAEHPTQVYKNIKNFFASMSMNITKWATNDTEVRAAIPTEYRDDEIRQPLLGLKWHTTDDTLALKLPKQLQGVQVNITRRQLLSQMASVFDPLGWAAPITLLAKIFIRKNCEAKTAWDANLNNIQAQWNEVREQLKRVNEIIIQREMAPAKFQQKTTKIYLHTFVDASDEAYAAVTYIVFHNETEAAGSIVMARSRLAPKKVMTTPRLELIALVMGTRLSNFIRNALHYQQQIQIHIWSDSACVIQWTETKKILPPIIERRIKEIKTYDNIEIHHVPAALNRADVASRGAGHDALQQINWWSPPDWLLSRESWPKNEMPEMTKEDDAILLLFEPQQQTPQPKSEDNVPGIAGIKIRDYSTLSKLLIHTWLWSRFVNWHLKKQIVQLQSENDTKTGLLKWIKWDQERTYRSVYPPHNKTSISNIRVFLDKDDIIRCHTRLLHSALSPTAISPILLVKDSSLTKLLILETHKAYKHAGPPATLAALRMKYWLPQGRRQVTKIINNFCFSCRKATAKTYPNPPVAPLPEFRVTRASRPFQATGLDIFGPYWTRTIQDGVHTKTKKWVLILTCAAIRAVHLEVLADMKVEEILLAFRRFVARRGVPEIIICDNAPQFKAIEGRVRNLWQTVTENESVVNYFVQRGIVWKYVPQNSPWMGGMYERIVQLAKRAFDKTYGRIVLQERQFEVSIIEIEGVLNARPLHYVEKAVESKVITPNSFLHLHFPAIKIDETRRADDDNITHLWRATERLLNQFWECWSHTYLQQLKERDDQLRKKHENAPRQPQVGDIVLIAESAKRRSSWKLAVIERLVPSNEGIVRAVQIRTANRSRTIRPVIKIAPIGLSMDLSSIANQPLNQARDAIIIAGPEGAPSTEQAVADDPISEEENNN